MYFKHLLNNAIQNAMSYTSFGMQKALPESPSESHYPPDYTLIGFNPERGKEFAFVLTVGIKNHLFQTKFHCINIATA